MTDGRIDFTTLRAGAEPERWHGVIAGALARIEPMLDARRQRANPLAIIASWARPLLAAAAVAGLLFGSLALIQEDEPDSSAAADLAAYSRSAIQHGVSPDGAMLLRVIGAGTR